MAALAPIRTTELRRRLSKKKISRTKRKQFSAREPKGATALFTKLLLGRLTRLENAADELLGPAIKQEYRADAFSEFLTLQMSLLRLRLIQIFDEDELDKDLEVIGEKVSRKNRSEIRRLIGVAVKHADPGVAAAIDVFRTGNVFKIKSLAEDQLADINRILADSFGERVEAVRDKIQERFGVTKSKATLLARDQTLTLNAQITKMRHQNLGITHYIWTSSADERVREIHSELDGTVQSWAAPPVVSPDGRTGHPGEDYQCRCTAFPVLPELS